MRPASKRTVVALTVAGLIAASLPAAAGPVPGNLASLGASAPQSVTEARSRGGGAVAAGIAAGIITGAIIAGAANSRYYYGSGPTYYYGPRYYYGPGYYEPPPYYYVPRYSYRAPVYVEPYGPRGGYGPVRQCWVSTDNDRGYGYWRPC